MLINEILTEAISLTQYEGTVQKMFTKGLQSALKRLSKLKGKFPDEERTLVQDENSYPLRIKLMGVLTRYLATDIAKEFKNLKTIDGSHVTDVKFIKTEYGGYARGTEIYISSRIIKNIANITVNKINDFAVNNAESYSDQLKLHFDICNSIATGSDRNGSYLLQDLLYDIQSGIDSIINTVTHEMVHTTQHGRQFAKGKGPFEIEYRSYLDKQKGEFYKLHNKKNWSKDPRASELYYASPQEIPAFAHEMALYIIRAYDLPNLTSVEEIPKVTPEDIAYAATRYPEVKKFSTSTDPKARAVYQRYMKLIYLEIQNYLEKLKQKLSKEAVPAA